MPGPYEPRSTPVLLNPRGLDENDDKRVDPGMMIERIIKDAFRRMTLHYEKGYVSGVSVFIHTNGDEGYTIREDFDWCDPHKRYRCGEVEHNDVCPYCGIRHPSDCGG